MSVNPNNPVLWKNRLPAVSQDWPHSLTRQQAVVSQDSETDLIIPAFNINPQVLTTDAIPSIVYQFNFNVGRQFSFSAWPYHDLSNLVIAVAAKYIVAGVATRYFLWKHPTLIATAPFFCSDLDYAGQIIPAKCSIEIWSPIITGVIFVQPTNISLSISPLNAPNNFNQLTPAPATINPEIIVPLFNGDLTGQVVEYFDNAFYQYFSGMFYPIGVGGPNFAAFPPDNAIPLNPLVAYSN